MREPSHAACLFADGLGLQDDITRIVAALRPEALRAVLAGMAGQTPRTLEALLLHALPPAAAELMTQKLEHCDAQLIASGRQAEVADFYRTLYGCVEDPQLVLRALLHRKEVFSAQVLQQVMHDLLGPGLEQTSANEPTT